jgi:hypothetical protein
MLLRWFHNPDRGNRPSGNRDQALHAPLAHVAERHRRAGRVSLIAGYPRSN